MIRTKQQRVLDKTKADTSVAVAVLVRNLQIDARRRNSMQHVRAMVKTCAFMVR